MMRVGALLTPFEFPRRRREGKFVRSYFAALAILISGSVLSAGLLGIYYQYQENWELYGRIQKEIANSTAEKIEGFIGEIENAMKAATRSREIVRDGLTPEYKWELRRLLVNTSSITEAVAFDLDGHRRAEARRLSGVPSPEKWAPATAWRKFNPGERLIAPVYFGSGSGPFTTIAVPIDRVAGERIGFLGAEVDLKYIGQLMASVRVGQAGRAYLMDRSGQLIAHPDLSLVLQRPTLSPEGRLRAAFRKHQSGSTAAALVARNLGGEKVFTSFTPVRGLDWVVLVEQPVREIYTSLYSSMVRTAVLLALGLVLALIATLSIRRRIVQPLEMLRHGVAGFRLGDLTGRLEIKTGDEIEILADEFNDMARNLKEAYAGLEQKVAERTQQLLEANRKLATASEQKSQFLANVNHELRTPLSSIIGYARLLRRGTQDQISSLQQENLDDLLRNAERLLESIDSLLDLVRIEAGKIDVRTDLVRLDELVRSAAATVEAGLDRETVRLVRDVPADLAPIHTDREKLRQIVLNLLGNAVKFTDHGEVRISACQQDGVVKLAVEDTGIGIDPADLNRIFEEFDRGRLSNDRRYRGTGLGLTIAKRLVKVLGGAITVESNVGQGSVFTVTLPLNPAAERL